MMGLMAQQAFDAEASVRSSLSERQVLSSASRPAKVGKRHITRNRTSYSCQNCRKRKIKCDKVHPNCRACVKNGDQCIYGKFDAGVVDDRPESRVFKGFNAQGAVNPTPERRSTQPRTQAAAKTSQLDHLFVLENQLARLTSMVESLRQENTSLAANGLQTPTSSQSSKSGHANSGHGESPAHSVTMSAADAEALDGPMSELRISRPKVSETGRARDTFWESISEELDHLQTLLREPFSNMPVAHPDGDACEGGAKPDPFNPLPRDDQKSPIGFHGAAQKHEHSMSPIQCRVCQQASTDKSIFLLGLNSQQVRAMPKLNLTAGVPSEAQSNALFRTWVTGAFPILPFLPLQQVYLKYTSFWEWKRRYDANPVDMTESADIYFLPVLNTIWYSGVLAMSTKGIAAWFPDKSRAELAAHYHDQIVRYLAFLSFPTNVKLPFVGTLMVLEIMLCAEQDPLQSSSYLNLIVRLAQSVGINREGSQVGATPYDIEIRRRMWSQIVRLDTALSISSGMPSSIDDNLTDTLPISEVKEYLIGSEAERRYHDDIKSGRQKIGIVDDPYGPTRSMVSVYHLVSKASSLVDIALRKILRIHMSPQQITRETLTEMNSIISDTEQSVKDIISIIPTKGVPELGFEPEASTSPVYDCDPVLGSSIEEAELSNHFGPDVSGKPSNLTKYHRQKLCAFHKWARITLSLICDKMHCIAYAPFLKNSRSKLWTVARQCALHHATSLIRKFVCVANDPVLEPFRWSWPAMFQPMHAAIVILVDVYERPFSIEAPRNRSWIDKLFALAHPDTGIVGGLNGPSTQRPLRDGGAEAWDQLRGLRSSAWRKAGLAPEVLWTEEDQIIVGVAKPLTEEQRIAQTLREDLLYDDSPKWAQGASKATQTFRGIQYLMDLGREEARNIERSQILDYALTDQAEQVFATFKPPPSRTVKLEGQQEMPFPLSSEATHRCKKAERQYDSPVVDQPTTTTETIFMEDLVKKIKACANEQSGVAQVNDHPRQRTGVNAFLGKQMIGDIHLTPHASRTTKNSVDPSKKNFNGIVPNGLQVDYSAVQESELEMPASAPEPTVEASASANDSPDSFDWEKWDAVFGQYGGFTDLMEDIQWEDPDPT